MPEWVGGVILKISQYRDGYISGFLRLDFFGVHNNLGMENLLGYALVDIVADSAHKDSLRQCRDFTLRNQAVHLRVYGVAHIVTVDAHGLALLQYLSESFGKCLGGFANDLSGEDVADGIHHHGSLLVTIVAFELREILKAEADGNLVASSCGYKIVEVP